MSQRLLVVAVVAAGGLLGLQGRINGELGSRMHSALDAAAISFTVGTLLLGAVVVASHRRGAVRLVRARTRWWWWLGGLAGAAVVASTADGVPQVGVALVTVCIVAGASAGALAVDQLGLGPGGVQRVTRLRLGGAGLAVAAVALGVVADRHASVRPALFTALFVAGAASAVQLAANGLLRQVADDTAVASLVSFAGGTAALIAAVLVHGDLAGRHWPATWWMYVGGALGAVYIVLAAVSVHELGVLRLSLATVAGQLLGGILLDVAWPAPGISLHPATIAGAALTLVAVAVAGAGRRQAGAAVGPAGAG